MPVKGFGRHAKSNKEPMKGSKKGINGKFILSTLCGSCGNIPGIHQPPAKHLRVQVSLSVLSGQVFLPAGVHSGHVGLQKIASDVGGEAGLGFEAREERGAGVPSLGVAPFECHPGVPWEA